MTTYVLRNGELVEKANAYRLDPKIHVVRDIGAYVSPVCGADGKHPVIDGRAAQREDLKRNNCRVKEPSETLARSGIKPRPEPVVTESMMRTMAETYDRMQGR